MSIILQGLGGGALVLQGYGSSSSSDFPTLIVEDGSAKPDAESFCSVAFADDYFQRRLIVAWDNLTLQQKEAALRKGTDYMEQEFRLRWAGYKYTVAQALSWPRWEVYSLDVAYGYYGWSNYVGFDTVPELVQRACAELALRAASTPLSIDVGRLKERIRIGGNSGVDVTYAKSSYNQNTVYTAVEDWLRPFFNSWSSPGMAHTVRLERA